MTCDREGNELGMVHAVWACQERDLIKGAVKRGRNEGRHSWQVEMSQGYSVGQAHEPQRFSSVYMYTIFCSIYFTHSLIQQRNTNLLHNTYMSYAEI